MDDFVDARLRSVPCCSVKSRRNQGLILPSRSGISVLNPNPLGISSIRYHATLLEYATVLEPLSLACPDEVMPQHCRGTRVYPYERPVKSKSRGAGVPFGLASVIGSSFLALENWIHKIELFGFLRFFKDPDFRSTKVLSFAENRVPRGTSLCSADLSSR